MSKHPPSFDRMLDAWNETDAARIRQHLDAALAPDVVVTKVLGFFGPLAPV